MGFRKLIAIPIGFLATFFLFLGIFMPFSLLDQAEDERRYLREFETVAAHADMVRRSSGHVVDDLELQQWAVGQQLQIGRSLLLSTDNCPGFAKGRGDRFEVSFWRGEWTECYAAPSGRTTLNPSLWALLKSGLAIDIAAHWAMGVTLLLCCWWLVRHREGGSASSNFA